MCKTLQHNSQAFPHLFKFPEILGGDLEVKGLAHSNSGGNGGALCSSPCSQELAKMANYSFS